MASEGASSSSPQPKWQPAATGRQHKFKLAERTIDFLRGPRLCGCQEAAGSADIETRAVSPLEASVVGRLFKYKKRPLSGNLVKIRVKGGSRTSMSLASAQETLTVELESKGGAMISKKKILLWHGQQSDLGGAAWDDIQLLNVSAGGSLPFDLRVTAQYGGTRQTLGVLDVLLADPDSAERLRTARYGLFRTRTPGLQFVVADLIPKNLQVYFDDGENDTQDELNVTALVNLSGDLTAVSSVPGWVSLNGGPCKGKTNTEAGVRRLHQECIDPTPEGGDCALFMYGENRIQIFDGNDLIFCSHSFHYLQDSETVPSGYFLNDEVKIDGNTIEIVKGSLSLDFTAETNDEGVSRTLHALQLRPRSFSGRYNIVEGRVHEKLSGSELLALCDQIKGWGEPALEDVSITPLFPIGRGETGFLERLPEFLHGDFVAANRTFTNRDHHWHHFVIHTFPAHRLIESQIIPDTRPPQVAVSGVNFETRKTFIRPEAADSLRRVGELNAEEPTRKIAIFGHTDRVGDEASNNQLSLLRAQSMEALLRHNVGFWFDRFHAGAENLGTGTRELQWALKELGDFAGPIDGTESAALTAAVTAYKTRRGQSGSTVDLTMRRTLAQDIRARIGAVNAPLVNETAWGMREIQHMLRRLGHYTGPINGVNNAATRDAVKAEQAAHNLTQDGEVGLATRVELIRDYMNSLVPAAFAPDRFHAGAVFGCGEAFPRVPTADNVESVQNRRVEVIFRRTPVTPINAALLGGAVPYREWLAPEFADDRPPGIPNIVVAITDSGFGRGAADNFTGEQLTQPNHLLIKGERWIRPTNTTGAFAGNPKAQIVTPDGDLTQVGDVGVPGAGHGSAVATCMGADGVGTPIAGAPRGPLNGVIGTAPHVKIRPIQLSASMGTYFFPYMLALEVIASDPDVLVYSTSVAYHTSTGLTAGNVRALRERASDLTMQGKVVLAVPQNYNGAFPANYHASRTHWGGQSPDRRNPRSGNTGANEYIRRLAVVGATARVGTAGAPISALVNAPGQQEIVANFTHIGESVNIHMPGNQIRALMPTASGLSGGMGNSTALAAPENMTVGGIDGTSFATPLTAGVVAELMLLDPALRQPANVARVLEYVEATCDPILNINPAGGTGAPGNTRVNDPIIAGNAAHPAFSGIRRVNYWKAVLAALNKGLSNEGRGANGATDARFTFCTLRDDSVTIWYGFELRSSIADPVVWFRKPSGEFVLAEDEGALFPNDRITGTAWRTTDAFQLAANQPLPAFPWTAAEFTAAGRQQLFLCQFSIEKAKLQNFQALVLHLPGIDPRDPEGAEGPPVLELRVDNRAALRVPAGAGGAITAFVTAFDDFVFHVSAIPQPFSRFQFFVQDRRTGSAIGETILVRMYAVDAFGNLTNPPGGAITLTHNGTAGNAAGPVGVFLNGNPAGAAGINPVFGAAGDPPGLARIQFQGNSAETVRLSVTGQPGTVDIHVTPVGALASFGLEIRRPAGGASVVSSPPRAGEQLELVVRAIDAEGRLVTTFNDEITLSLTSGEMGSDGPPNRSGVHIKNADPAPFNAAAFRHRFTTTGATPDNGTHTFTFFNYTAGPLQFKATSGAIEGTSRDLDFRAGRVTQFSVDATSPQTLGNEFNVVVTALDAAGNRLEDFEGAVTLATVPGRGTAPVVGPPRVGVFIGSTSLAGDDTYTFVHTDGGVHNFPVTCHTAETVQFRATHTPAVGPPISSTGRNITIQAAGALARFRFERRGADRAGVRFELTVIVEDAAGHKLTGFGGNVTLSLVPGRGTAFSLGPPPTGVLFETAPGTAGNAHVYAAADNGAFMFLITPNTAETINIRATSGAITTDTGDIPIEGGVFDHFTVVPAGGARRNVPFNVVVTARDVSNNVVPHFLGQVTLSVRVGAGAFAPIAGATHAFADADRGQFTFSVTLTTNGANHVIQASDGNITNQPSAPFNVAP